MHLVDRCSGVPDAVAHAVAAILTTDPSRVTIEHLHGRAPRLVSPPVGDVGLSAAHDEDGRWHVGMAASPGPCGVDVFAERQLRPAALVRLVGARHQGDGARRDAGRRWALAEAVGKALGRLPVAVAVQLDEVLETTPHLAAEAVRLDGNVWVAWCHDRSAAFAVTAWSAGAPVRRLA